MPPDTPEDAPPGAAPGEVPLPPITPSPPVSSPSVAPGLPSGTAVPPYLAEEGVEIMAPKRGVSGVQPWVAVPAVALAVQVAVLWLLVSLGLWRHRRAERRRRGALDDLG
ncbi:hypothetical protein [Thermomonospora cellulosilytica]|uniref:Uncharacterized protein n=2 Tax=Thermomonospora TaxID=2019 RepID=A0A7W3MTZ4_9ACTN|nr:hypothetical protein [Thermomonospora cellulosilytica]MBA9001824.1 hypothetical protein [Thermomonospora cellulosilytica]